MAGDLPWAGNLLLKLGSDAGAGRLLGPTQLRRSAKIQTQALDLAPISLIQCEQTKRGANIAESGVSYLPGSLRATLDFL